MGTISEMLLLLTRMVFFERIMCFFNLAEKINLKQKELISTLKSMIGRKYYFQN
jgi:hypothetical protein